MYGTGLQNIDGLMAAMDIFWKVMYWVGGIGVVVVVAVMLIDAIRRSRGE